MELATEVPITPENYSTSLEGTPSTHRNSETTDSQVEYVNKLIDSLSTRKGQEGDQSSEVVQTPSAKRAVAYSTRDFTSYLTAAGGRILQARDHEILADAHHYSSVAHHTAEPRSTRTGIGRFFRKSTEAFIAPISPEQRRQQREIEYVQREKDVVGSKIIDDSNMQFFCQDANTWVWHIDGSEGPQTFVYHIRPDGVLKQRIGAKESTAISGPELESFAHYVGAYTNGVLARVYN